MQQIHLAMKHGAADEWPDIELTMTQFRAVAFIGSQPQRMGSVAAYLETSLSSATSIVDRLVDKSLVQRRPDHHDRRVVTCSLTVEGEAVMQKFWQIGRRSLVCLADHMTDSQLSQVVDSMRIVYDASLRVRSRIGNDE
jgi:DNA-binding MarR family transcriptional regulator